MLHFGVTKNDLCLVFAFDDLNKFKSWSKLSLTEFEMSITNSKKWKTDAHSLHVYHRCVGKFFG